MEDSIMPTRIHVFVDYWNFQLSLGGVSFKIDWARIGPWLAMKAAEQAGLSEARHTYSGMNVYSSYDPRSGNFAHRDWVEGFLARLPGVAAHCIERRARRAPRCNSCGYEVSLCPNCRAKMEGTTEKGLDILLATDMVRMGMEDGLDLAVLVSNDSDFVPVVKSLQSRLKRVVHAGFAPRGAALAVASDARVNLSYLRGEIPQR